MLSALTCVGDLDHICHVGPCQHSVSKTQMYVCPLAGCSAVQSLLSLHQLIMPSCWLQPGAFPQLPNGMTTTDYPCGSCCSYSGGSYQQHLGMLEQWIDGNGRAQATPTSSDGRRRKGAKGAGQSAFPELSIPARHHCILLCKSLSSL